MSLVGFVWLGSIIVLRSGVSLLLLGGGIVFVLVWGTIENNEKRARRAKFRKRAYELLARAEEGGWSIAEYARELEWYHDLHRTKNWTEAEESGEVTFGRRVLRRTSTVLLVAVQIFKALLVVGAFGLGIGWMLYKVLGLSAAIILGVGTGVAVAIAYLVSVYRHSGERFDASVLVRKSREE